MAARRPVYLSTGDVLTEIADGDTIAAGLLPGTSVFARKTSDQSVTSSTTVVNDSELVCPVEAGSVYVVTGSIIAEGATTGDMKHRWTAPTGATFDWTSYGQGSGASAAIASVDQNARTLTGSTTHGLLGTGSPVAIRIQGLLVVSTAGSFQYQWAQNTSDATATTVHPGSFLLLTKVA